MQILKYIFSRSYTSYKNSLGIKPDRIQYSSAIVGFLIAFNVIAILCIPLILINYKYSLIIFIISGISTVFSTVRYLKTGGRYYRIIKEVEEYSVETKKTLKRKSVVYIIVSVALFLWVWYRTLPF